MKRDNYENKNKNKRKSNFEKLALRHIWTLPEESTHLPARYANDRQANRLLFSSFVKRTYNGTSNDSIRWFKWFFQWFNDTIFEFSNISLKFRADATYVIWVGLKYVKISRKLCRKWGQYWYICLYVVFCLFLKMWFFMLRYTF